ncbi:MAG: CheR family methyltransferase [Omnitrophica WOR_2 bacterium]
MDANKGSSKTTLELLSDLVRKHTGFSFDGEKEYLLLEKFNLLMEEKNIDNLIDYYFLLKYGDQEGDEWRSVQSALAVNESYFWREYDQIDAAVNVIIPQIMSEKKDRTIRIWSAGCASGEEPYTLAMSINEAGWFEKGDIEILATDFDEHALTLARAGLYRSRSFRSIPAHILYKYFLPENGKQYRLVEGIRSKVKFVYMNLVEDFPDYPQLECDLIFCRNVFIYFSQEARQKTLHLFYHCLRDSGYLCVAAAESLLRITDLFDLTQVDKAYVYKKVLENKPKDAS